jgi:putative ABC transport system substrate-binding protein
MTRRELITIVGGAAAWPLVAHAQQPAKRIVGFLGDSTPLAESERAAAFARRLHDLGWIEGRTMAIEYRWADGRSDRLAEIAAEFARLKVDVIVTGGTPAVMAAKQAAPVIPIVFAAVGDPVGIGIVASSTRGEALRPSGRAADQVRASCQSDHREGARPRRAAHTARPR